MDVEAGEMELYSGGNFAGAYNTAAGRPPAGGVSRIVLNALPNFTGVGTFTLVGGTLVMNNDIDPALQLIGGTVVLGPSFQNGGAINNLVMQGGILAVRIPGYRQSPPS